MRDKRAKTLKLSIFFSSFGPFVTGYALFMNTTSTQLSDFLRRTAELMVLILALVIYNLLNEDINQQKKELLRKVMIRSVGIVLVFTALVLLFISIRNILNPTVPSGNVWLGLSVAMLGLLFNGAFMIRYTLFNRRKKHAVMASQGKLYQAKVLVDLSVIIALGAVVVFGEGMRIFWIDTIVTLIISLYLLFRGSMLFILKAENL